MLVGCVTKSVDDLKTFRVLCLLQMCTLMINMFWDQVSVQQRYMSCSRHCSQQPVQLCYVAGRD